MIFYADDAVTLHHGDALALPLEDSTVDLVCTSPPYFGLRSYQDGGAHCANQIGAEATPAEFVNALIRSTAEMVRVLKPTGSIWINLGDKYAQATERSRNGINGELVGTNPLRTGPNYGGRLDNGVPRKSLIGIPWRYALRCIDDLGLILRAEVIWSKPNGLPESVTDRIRRSHETWFHFAKQPRYYSTVDEIREPYEPDSAARRIKYGNAARGGGYAAGDRNDAVRGGPMGFADAANANPLGKLPGSVWSIPTQPLKVPAELGIDHFAAFPMEWPRRIIQGWSPPGVCTACREGRRLTLQKKPMVWRESPTITGRHAPNTSRKPASGTMLSPAETTITGYACGCSDTAAPTTPAVVLDPFGGTGTTALMAKVLGRHGVYVDLSADYCRLAQWRCTDPGQLHKAANPKPPKTRKAG